MDREGTRPGQDAQADMDRPDMSAGAGGQGMQELAGAPLGAGVEGQCAQKSEGAALRLDSDTPDPLLELQIKLTPADLYDYLLYHGYTRGGGLLGSCLGAVMALVGAVQGQWLFVAGGAALLLYLPWTLGIRSRSQFLANPHLGRMTCYRFDKKGLTISQGEESQRLDWEQMWGARATGRCILLYTSRIHAAIFPRRQLEGGAGALIQVLSAYMPPAKVRIRF